MEDNYLYSKWLRNELSEEEKKELKESGDLEILERIVSETDKWKLPESRSYEELKIKLAERKNREEAKVIAFPTTWIVSIAASLLLLIAGYWLFLKPSIITFSSNPGQALKVTLPDQTTVILNGKSTLSYNEKNWLDDRKVDFTGEAYFDVTKKGSFKVFYENGEINVLGTRFDVLSNANIASVKCYEGKVLVKSDKQVDLKILTAGKGLRYNRSVSISDTFDLSNSSPDWVNNETVFRSTPLYEIINQLAVHYDVTFETGKVDVHRKYSGKIIYKDLETSLNAVFQPMQINYTIRDGEKKKIILQ